MPPLLFLPPSIGILLHACHQIRLVGLLKLDTVCLCLHARHGESAGFRGVVGRLLPCGFEFGAKLFKFLVPEQITRALPNDR